MMKKYYAAGIAALLSLAVSMTAFSGKHMKKEKQSQPAEEVQEKDIRRSNRPTGILTVDASGAMAERDSEDAAWHELVNAYRTRKILSGDLGGMAAAFL